MYGNVNPEKKESCIPDPSPMSKVKDTLKRSKVKCILTITGWGGRQWWFRRRWRLCTYGWGKWWWRRIIWWLQWWREWLGRGGRFRYTSTTCAWLIYLVHVIFRLRAFLSKNLGSKSGCVLNTEKYKKNS